MSNSKKNDHDRKFAENMAGFFHDFFRASGLTMPAGNSMERVRSTGEKMATAILDAASIKATSVSKELQDRVNSGFIKLEEAFDKVKNLQVQSSTMLLETRDELRALRVRVAAIEAIDLKDFKPCKCQKENQPIDGVMGSDSWETDGGS